MSTQTLTRKVTPQEIRRISLLQEIRAWREGVGVKLKGWNEVKAIRRRRDRR